MIVRDLIGSFLYTQNQRFDKFLLISRYKSRKLLVVVLELYKQITEGSLLLYLTTWDKKASSTVTPIRLLINKWELLRGSIAMWLIPAWHSWIMRTSHFLFGDMLLRLPFSLAIERRLQLSSQYVHFRSSSTHHPTLGIGRFLGASLFRITARLTGTNWLIGLRLISFLDIRKT